MKKTLRTLCAGVLLCALVCGALTFGVSATSPTSAADESAIEVIPGGIPFGVKFTTEGILIVGFSDITTSEGQKNPAREAGLKLRDVLTEIDGTPLTSAADLTAKITASAGQPLHLVYTRGGKKGETDLTPVCDTEGQYKTGLFVRDSGAGIGTVTFVLPKTGMFGGLGHGICDVDTGELMPLHRGQVVDVTISGINRGAAGAPGELRGYFGVGKQGTLLGNTECGVYGLYRRLPDALSAVKPCPVGRREELREGEATVLCTLSDGKRGEYRVQISSINHRASGSKCFTVKVTDPALLEQTGGIVQGMSGSPILQNGKLVGAVTHVLINDPTVGYGIFIENMLAGLPSAA